MSTSHRKPGVRAVAAATGVSVATVSRVINNANSVHEDTRRRVLNVMKEIGFTPNPVARALSTRRTRIITAVIPTIESSIFAKFLDAVEQELAIDSYALVIATSNNQKDREAARAKAMLEMGAEGVILSGATHSAEMRELLTTRNIPSVCTSIYLPGSDYPTIGYDNLSLGELAIRHLRDLGHERFAIFHGPRLDNDRTALRLQGAETALRREPDLLRHDTTYHQTSLSVEGGVSAVRDMLATGQLPTAILCLSDVIALGALFELRRAGLKVPDDVSVMGFDDLDWAAVCDPPLTSISLPTVEMGRLAARALIDHLDGGKPIESLRLEAGIVERASVTRAN